MEFIKFHSVFSCGLAGTMLCVELTRELSVAPKLVCLRSKEPNTRRPFDSSEPRDVNEPVLQDFRCGLFRFD